MAPAEGPGDDGVVKRFVVAGVAAVVFACAAGAARADVAVVPNDGSTPFDGGAEVTSPLEAAAGAIASHIAGRPVSVRCEADADWATLAGNAGYQPSQILGYVTFLNGGAGDVAELSSDICRSLQTFAAATTKPTKCQVATRVVVRIRRKRTYSSVLQPFAPCFVNGAQLNPTDQPFWNQYFYVAEALQTLAHESIHLQGDPVEADAECYGMQWVAYAAQQLGDTPDDAAAIAQYYATRLYPTRQSQSPAYWSPECRPNGKLDLTPGDNAWP